MTADLSLPNDDDHLPAPEAPKSLSIPENRVDIVYRVADQFAEAAMHDASVAIQLRGGPGTGTSRREYATGLDKEACLRRREARASMAAAGENWKTAVLTVRFAKELEAGQPPKDANEPVDQATQALIDARAKRAQESVEAGRAMIASAGELDEP